IRPRVRAVGFIDPGYPRLLTAIPLPPAILYVRGEVADGALYLSARGRAVTALNASSGEAPWRSGTNAAGDTVSAVANGAVYVAGSDGSVYALYVRTGAQRWRFQTDGAQGLTSPVVANGTVYVGFGNDLCALNA